MNITAKAVVSSKTPNIDGQTNLNFRADYSNGRNKDWAKFTPILNLTMVVLDSVAEQFSVDQAFTLTFTPEEVEGTTTIEESGISEQSFDDEDVPAALARVTQDGPGIENPETTLPEGDFDSFAEPDVEKEDEI